MPEVVGELIETPGESLPYKGVFIIGGTAIAERPVTSPVAGEELIGALSPKLQGYDPGGI